WRDNVVFPALEPPNPGVRRPGGALQSTPKFVEQQHHPRVTTNEVGGLLKKERSSPVQERNRPLF
ncbi:MAG TPA: hypothetical protein VIR01_03430, partial [Pyrinomonadaceae bacterium]